MMTREELDTEIVVAITVFRAAKREELVKAVDEAWGAWAAATVATRVATMSALDAATAALKAYDKENT